MRAGLHGSDPKTEALGEIYLGDRDFARRRRPRRPASTEVPRLQREPIGCSLEELLRGRSDDALALAYRAGYSLRELAAVLGVHYSTATRRLKREEQALGLAKVLRRKT